MVEVTKHGDTWFVRLTCGPLPTRPLLFGTPTVLEIEPSLDDMDAIEARLVRVEWGRITIRDVHTVQYIRIIARYLQCGTLAIAPGECVRVLIQMACATWTNADWKQITNVLASVSVTACVLETACTTRSCAVGALEDVRCCLYTCLAPHGFFEPGVTDWNVLHRAIHNGTVTLVLTRVSLPDGTEFVLPRARGAEIRGIWFAIYRMAEHTMERRSFSASRASMHVGGMVFRSADMQFNTNTLETHGIDDETVLDVRRGP